MEREQGQPPCSWHWQRTAPRFPLASSDLLSYPFRNSFSFSFSVIGPRASSWGQDQ